ncbi:MAG: RNA polymerase sigma factor [Planctomycetota bacterium]
MLRTTGRPDVAEDVTQEAFVRALANLHRFDERFRFSTWLFTIAKRLYVNARQKRSPVFSTDVVGEAQQTARRGTTETASPAQSASRDESDAHVHDALQEALLSLGEDQREIVVLFHQLDWPIALIAEHMGMPEGTIKSHLHRSRRRLRGFLERNEATERRCHEALERARV